MSFPRGPDGAHQVINNSDEVARILMLSTMVEPDIAEYPDSGKFGLFSGSAPGGSGERSLQTFIDRGAVVDYFEGE